MDVFNLEFMSDSGTVQLACAMPYLGAVSYYVHCIGMWQKGTRQSSKVDPQTSRTNFSLVLSLVQCVLCLILCVVFILQNCHFQSEMSPLHLKAIPSYGSAKYKYCIF